MVAFVDYKGSTIVLGFSERLGRPSTGRTNIAGVLSSVGCHQKVADQ
jgi:hypothetical protein